MRMQIDEAGGNEHAAGINHLGRLMRFEIADLRDKAALNPEVGLVSRHPRSVDHHSPSDEHVEFSHSHLPWFEVRAPTAHAADSFTRPRLAALTVLARDLLLITGRLVPMLARQFAGIAPVNCCAG